MYRQATRRLDARRGRLVDLQASATKAFRSFSRPGLVRGKRE